MAKIFLSVPVLFRPELRFMYSMYNAILTCREHRVRLYFNENDSLISRVRNVHMSMFLHEFKECEYYMSLDSDMELMNVYPTNNIFSKLISHNVDFVGGLYAVKKPGVRRSSSIAMDGKPVDFDKGLREMRWMSSGCWCIKRSAVERIADAYPELTYNGDDNVVGKKIHALFMPMLYDFTAEDLPESELPCRKYLSEDWAWCNRWKQIGGKIYADTSIYLKHIGSFDYTLWDLKTEKVEVPNPPPAGYDLKEKIK